MVNFSNNWDEDKNRERDFQDASEEMYKRQYAEILDLEEYQHGETDDESKSD